MDTEKTRLGVAEQETIAQVSNVSKLAIGSEEHKNALEGIAKLYKVQVDEEKIDAEFTNKESELKLKERELDIRETENKAEQARLNRELKAKERALDLEAERIKVDKMKVRAEQAKAKAEAAESARKAKADKFDLVMRGIEVSAKVGLGLFTAIYAAKNYRKAVECGLRFEETGVFSSTTTRQVIKDQYRDLNNNLS